MVGFKPPSQALGAAWKFVESMDQIDVADHPGRLLVLA
jgi:hypothetical protein